MLTAPEAQEAALMGWQLCEIYDDRQETVLLAILPTSFVAGSAVQAANTVVALAKANNRLAIKALTLIAQHNISKKAKK